MKVIMEKMKSHTGAEFNKNLVAAPLNKSGSKASFSFSRAKRFSNVSVNDQGFAITVLNPKNTQTSNKVGFTSATTSPSGILGGRPSNLQLNK